MSGAAVLVSFLLVFVTVLLLFSNLKIKIYGYFDGDDIGGHIDFEIHNLRLTRLKLGRKKRHKYSLFKNREKFYKSLGKYTVNLLEVNGALGLGDAAVTAITVGGVYSVLYFLYSILFNRIKVEKTVIDLKPDFERVKFSFDVLCIIDVKVVNIMIDVIKVWVDYTREKFENKEEESLLWQSTR